MRRANDIKNEDEAKRKYDAEEEQWAKDQEGEEQMD
jgi:hypothetical protein